MGKIIIHCVRHAQGYHNLNTASHSIHDPSLTPLGESQCSALAEAFPSYSPSPSHSKKITHLVASPLRRTLYTCLLSFPSQVAAGMKVLALPELQETSDLPCDTGSAPGVLAAEFGREGARFEGCVDLGRVHEGWNSNEGVWSPRAEAIEARAREGRRVLLKLGEDAKAVKGGEDGDGDGDVEIVVVTHGGFLHYFTEDWDGHEKFTGTGWANTEVRSYEFVTGAEEGASLMETRESRLRRLGREIPLTRDEQRELRASAEKGWQESGFQTPPVEEEIEAKL